MRILITGANGFIGRHILSKLNENDNYILAVDIQEKHSDVYSDHIEWLYKDISRLDDIKTRIKDFNPEVVIHTAWQGIPDFSETISILNLNNSIRFLDYIIAETTCRKFIISGSCFEYGKKTGAVKETDSTAINSYFSWAKQSLYNYLSFKCPKHKIQLFWFRYFYVYGPGQRQDSLIPSILNSLINGNSLDIRNPYNKNDFIYVKDVANATSLAVSHEKMLESGIYNLGCGYSTSVYDICRISELLLKGKEDVSKTLMGIKKGEYLDFWADIKKINSSLDWTPLYSFENGIKEMIDSFHSIN